MARIRFLMAAVRDGADAQGRAPVADHRPQAELVPLSSAQRRLWFLWQLEGPTATYNIPLAFRLTGRLEREALRAALRDVLRRHETLRMVFPDQDGQPRQQLADRAADCLSLPVTQVGQAELAAALAAAARGGFDLSQQLPVRACLFEVSADDHVLLVVMHHIAADAWSLDPLGRDLAAAYAARSAGGEPGWAPLPARYADYAVRQRELLARAGHAESPFSRQLTYWISALAGLPAELALPADRARPAVTSYRSGLVPLRLDGELHARLLDLARRCQATMFMVIHAGLVALLTRLGAGTDIPVGTATAGRADEGWRDMVGCLVNTLVLRADTSGDPGFLDLLGRVRDVDLAAYSYPDVPFGYLVEALKPTRSMARHPLCQVMLTLTDSVVSAPRFTGMRTEPLPVDLAVTACDLSFSFRTGNGGEGAEAGLSGDLRYAADMFDADTAGLIAVWLARLLAAAVADPDLPVGRAELLSEAERHGLLAAGTGSATEVRWATVAQLFAAQAARSPDAVAVTCRDSALTYHELATRCWRLARCLRLRGVGPDVLVGLCVEPGMEMVTGLLAILAAGGAYVPVDPGYPAERIAFLLQDSGAALVLTLERLRDRLPAGDQVVISIDATPEVTADGLDGPPPLVAFPASLAYVTYTSGSTGRPKGVAVTHRNVVNLVSDRCWRSGHHGRLLFHSPYSFDASTYELWVPLLSGGRVVMTAGRRVDAGDLECVIAENEVTAAYFTTALFEVMAQEAKDGLGQLREIWTGGDVLSPAALQRVLENCRDTTVMHAYGPTETTVFCSFQKFGVARRRVTTLTFGVPMDNTRMYLLDSRLRPMLPGVVGEIYLAGEGLAREYLRRPGLTADRFVADPFGDPGTRMYRTGDLARWHADGELEFAGRSDDQAKVRGFRVEPGEVEAVLARHPAVGQVAVVAREDRPGDKRLVGYVVPVVTGEADVGALRAFAREHLPDHLIPSVFMVVGRLPLTPNGKLDRRALPSPRAAQREPGPGYQAPRTLAEKAVARVWADVLGVRQAGIGDNFFDLGGDSFLALRAASRLGRLFHVTISPRIIFQAPTIAELIVELTAAVALPQRAARV